MAQTNADREPPALAIHGYPVWDRTVRGFHWINFLCVVALAGIGTVILWADDLGIGNDGKLLLKTVHVWFGYLLAVNLAWRLVWAFIGSPFARWRALLPGMQRTGPSMGAYLGAMSSPDAPRYLGHNPIARLMVTALLLVLTLQALSGLVLTSTTPHWGPG